MVSDMVLRELHVHHVYDAYVIDACADIYFMDHNNKHENCKFINSIKKGKFL